MNTQCGAYVYAQIYTSLYHLRRWCIPNGGYAPIETVLANQNDCCNHWCINFLEYPFTSCHPIPTKWLNNYFCISSRILRSSLHKERQPILSPLQNRLSLFCWWCETTTSACTVCHQQLPCLHFSSGMWAHHMFLCIVTSNGIYKSLWYCDTVISN